MYLGVDPGLLGGFALVNRAGLYKSSRPMPLLADGSVDMAEMANYLESICQNVDFAVVEKMSGFVVNKCGKVAIRSLAFNIGTIVGMLVFCRIPHAVVDPQKWQRVIHAPDHKSEHPKVRSGLALHELFPGVDLRATKRSKKNHEGMMEALLIAEYARRCHK